MQQEHSHYFCQQQCIVVAATLHSCQVELHTRGQLGVVQVDQVKEGKLQIQQKDAYIQKLEARLLSKHRGPGSAKETASSSKGKIRSLSCPLLLLAICCSLLYHLVLSILH